MRNDQERIAKRRSAGGSPAYARCKRVGNALALIALACAFCFTPCFCQTSTPSKTAAEISKLLQKSKIVDTGRAVNTTVSGDGAIISTHSDPHATDNDCKITALMMMKELRLHFSTIHQIRVCFFNPHDPLNYREVSVREGDALLIDSGRSPSVVLSQIDVQHRSRRKTTTPAVSNNSGRQAVGSGYQVTSDSAMSQNDVLMKSLIMRTADTFHFSRAAEAAWTRYVEKRSNRDGQMTKGERTALYKDLKEQVNRSVSSEQRDLAQLALRSTFDSLGGVDD